MLEIMDILAPILVLSIMGLILGVGLGFAGKVLAVPVDPNLALVKSVLPGANCGGCGFAGCEAYAKAVTTGLAKANACPVGGADLTIKIARILGVDANVSKKMVSYVKCSGGESKAFFRYNYKGVIDCNAVSLLAGGGSKSCRFGCIGGGSCLNFCKFDAIDIVDGIAVINPDKCTACGMCIDACPRHLIELVPYDSPVRVSCMTQDPPKFIRKNCTVGCIGCKICEKNCEFDAIHVIDSISKVDYDKCTGCNVCFEKCPTKSIVNLKR